MITQDQISDSRHKFCGIAHELIELIRLRDEVRKAEAEQKARENLWSAQQREIGSVLH